MDIIKYKKRGSGTASLRSTPPCFVSDSSQVRNSGIYSDDISVRVYQKRPISLTKIEVSNNALGQ